MKDSHVTGRRAKIPSGGGIIESLVLALALLSVCLPAQSATQSKRYQSFDDVRAAYSDRIDGDADRVGWSLTTTPMSVKGKIFAIRFRVAQVIKKEQFILSLAGPAGDAYFMGVVSPSFGGDVDFVDGQFIGVIGEITGTYQYPTTMGGTRTVPKIKIYGARPD